MAKRSRKKRHGKGGTRAPQAPAPKPPVSPRGTGRWIFILAGLIGLGVAAAFMAPSSRDRATPKTPPPTAKRPPPPKIQELPGLPPPPANIRVPTELNESQKELAFLALGNYSEAIGAYRQNDNALFVNLAHKALQIFKRAQWLPRDLAPFHTIYVSLLFNGGHVSRALEEGEAWLKRHPESVHLREMLGKFYYLQKLFEPAGRHFEILAESYPNSLKTQRQLAQVYSSLGAKEKALTAVDRCLTLIGFQPGEAPPRIAGADVTLTVCLQVSHRFYDYEPLADIAEVVLQKKPGDQEALMALGVSERHLGRYDAAIEHLQAYLQVAPKESENAQLVKLDFGIALQKKNRSREAANVLVELLMRKPNSSKAYLHLGQALVRLGQSGPAESFLDRSRKLAPIDREFRRELEYRGLGQTALADRTLAIAHRMGGDYAQAEKVLREALRSGDTGHLVFYVEHLVSTVQVTKALREIQKLGEILGSGHTDVLGWTAQALTLKGEFARAAALLESVCKQGERALRSWGRRHARLCLDHLKDPSRARSSTKALVALGPEPDTKILHARSYFDAGDVEEAWKILDQLSPGTPGWRTEKGALWLTRSRARLGKDLDKAEAELEGLTSKWSYLPETQLARAEFLEAKNEKTALASQTRARAVELDTLRQKFLNARQEAGSSDSASTRAAHLLDGARVRYAMGDRDGALQEARLAAFTAPRGTAALDALEAWLDRPDEILEKTKVQRDLYALDKSRAPPPSAADLVKNLLSASSGVEKVTTPSRAKTDVSDSASSATPGVEFRDVTASSGVDFDMVCGDDLKDFIISVNGSGVAVLDYDLDGDLDLFFVNGSRLEPPYGAGAGSSPPSDALFRNDGGLKFTNVTQRAGLTESAWGCGVTVGDYDNDGDPDLFVANWGRDQLWQNQGDGTFMDVATRAGTEEPLWGSSCCFVDYDHDGFLDLFVVNYLDFDPGDVSRRGDDPSCQYKGQQILCGPIGLSPAPCTLYRNQGNGTFEDVSKRSGIRDLDLFEATYGLGVSLLDFDDDGKIDIYVANDSKSNLLFHNQGDGTFEEVALLYGVAVNDDGNAQAGMGVDTAFLDGKALEDIFVVNYESDTNTYHRNDDGYFTETTTPMGLASPCFEYLGWGAFFFDCDLDGDLDIFVAQGHVLPQANQIATSKGYLQQNKLFLNDGKGHFSDVSNDSGPGMKVKKSSRGAAYGDLDGDGDLDIVVNEIDGKATVLENVGVPTHHWLAVRAVGTKSNRSGIGAVVTVELPDGKTMRQRIRSGSSYASQSELVARFGLGNARKIKRIGVRWPTGEEEVFTVKGVDLLIEVVEGKGTK